MNTVDLSAVIRRSPVFRGLGSGLTVVVTPLPMDSGAEPDPVDHGRDTPQPRSEQLVQCVIHEPTRQIESVTRSSSAMESHVQHAMAAAAGRLACRCGGLTDAPR